MIGRRIALAAHAILAIACGGPQPAPAAPVASSASTDEAPPARPVTITVVGTNDLHGHMRALPVLAGYLAVLREERSADGGGVVVLDGGDLFQGTLESNLLEGAPIVRAYGLLGYDAAAIGNHEFDYGPAGERVTPASPDDDPRGALLANARAAEFAILNANLRRAADGQPIDWDHVAPSVLFERAGVRVGVIGVTTEQTLTTTISANVRDLTMEPLAQAIAREATSLRSRGADIVIVAAHAGGVCERFDDPHDTSMCRPGEEIFAVAEALPEHAVDAIVAGHTHAGVAHIVHGIPIVESFAYGRAFGRIDLTVDPERGVIDAAIHPPRELCASGSVEHGDCDPGEYEGHAIRADPRVTDALAPAFEHARALRERSLGVVLESAITRSYGAECALGNLFTDLMLGARPDADVALTNGGGLRADLPEGELTYGALYEAMPFDNRFARVRVTVADLARIVRDDLAHDGGFFSISGVRAEATCENGALRVRILNERGRPLPNDRELTLLTTDFLATGGDGALSEIAADRITIEDGEAVRDAMAEVLRAHGGRLRPSALFDPAHPRVRYAGPRPVRCGSQ